MLGTYRTLLAVMVVLTHLAGMQKIGAYAVFGFYILSGYLMTLIMQESYGYSTAGKFRFSINRFLRIYPTYWISVLVSLALIASLGNHFASAYHRSIFAPETLGEIARNVFIFFPERESPRLTPPSWALTVEIFFYSMICLGLSRTKLITRYWFAASVLYHLIAVLLGIGFEHRYFIIPAASLPFATGAMIYHHRAEIAHATSHLALRHLNILPIALLGAMFVNWFVGYKTNQMADTSFYVNFIICTLLAAVLVQAKSLPFIDAKKDKVIGELSYPIYLLHYQVGLVVIAICDSFGFELKRHDPLLFIIALPFIFGTAWLTVIAVERPLETLRRKFKRKQINQSASGAKAGQLT